MLDVLGDEYISQHILQSYREYLEQTSYKVYMSSIGKELVSMLSGTPLESSWSDVLHDLDDSVSYTKPQTESESEIKNRILTKLNGKEGDADGCI